MVVIALGTTDKCCRCRALDLRGGKVATTRSCMQAFFEFLVLVGGTPKRKPHGAESQKGRVREDAEQLPDIGQYAPEGFSDPVAGNGNPTNTTNVYLFACIQRFGGLPLCIQ